jgi:hypothetical protein
MAAPALDRATRTTAGLLRFDRSADRARHGGSPFRRNSIPARCSL